MPEQVIMDLDATAVLPDRNKLTIPEALVAEGWKQCPECGLCWGPEEMVCPDCGADLQKNSQIN